MCYLPAENIKILNCTVDTATSIVNIQIQFKIFRLLFTAYYIIITAGGASLTFCILIFKLHAGFVFHFTFSEFEQTKHLLKGITDNIIGAYISWVNTGRNVYNSK